MRPRTWRKGWLPLNLDMVIVRLRAINCAVAKEMQIVEMWSIMRVRTAYCNTISRCDKRLVDLHRSETHQVCNCRSSLADGETGDRMRFRSCDVMMV